MPVAAAHHNRNGAFLQHRLLALKEVVRVTAEENVVGEDDDFIAGISSGQQLGSGADSRLGRGAPCPQQGQQEPRPRKHGSGGTRANKIPALAADCR